jgi:outer membrane protein, multidrug efflux system
LTAMAMSIFATGCTMVPHYKQPAAPVAMTDPSRAAAG